jgi:hypothetical protein
MKRNFFKMKQVRLIALLSLFFLSSCSMTLEEIFLIPTHTPTPSNTSTITPTEKPSATPTVPTLTFTNTVTPQILRTDTPTPAESFTPTLDTVTPLILLTPDTATPTVMMEGSLSVRTSVTEFYKNGCEPGTVTITAQVANAQEVAYVVLFARFKSTNTGTTSEWTSIGMLNRGAGTFVYDLKPDEMKAVNIFVNTWVEYQFVATDAKAKQVGRTAIFSNQLKLLECVATPSPTVTVSPTATIKP